MNASLPPPGSFPSPSELGSAIWRTQRAIERAADALLAPLGLATPVVRILRLLDHQPGQSAADLARHMGLAPQSVALVLSVAQRSGLVERRAHPVHGRVQQVFLTPAGQLAYEKAAEAIASLERQLAADMDKGTKNRFWNQLRTVTERAEALTAHRQAK